MRCSAPGDAGAAVPSTSTCDPRARDIRPASESSYRDTDTRSWNAIAFGVACASSFEPVGWPRSVIEARRATCSCVRAPAHTVGRSRSCKPIFETAWNGPHDVDPAPKGAARPDPILSRGDLAGAPTGLPLRAHLFRVRAHRDRTSWRRARKLVGIAAAGPMPSVRRLGVGSSTDRIEPRPSRRGR